LCDQKTETFSIRAIRGSGVEIHNGAGKATCKEEEEEERKEGKEEEEEGKEGKEEEQEEDGGGRRRNTRRSTTRRRERIRERGKPSRAHIG